MSFLSFIESAKVCIAVALEYWKKFYLLKIYLEKKELFSIFLLLLHIVSKKEHSKLL